MSMFVCNVIAYSFYDESLFSYVVRSLISKLEEVDPRKLNHEEKLAFWINVHNSLMMHVMIFHNLNSFLLFSSSETVRL